MRQRSITGFRHLSTPPPLRWIKIIHFRTGWGGETRRMDRLLDTLKGGGWNLAELVAGSLSIEEKQRLGILIVIS